MSTVFRERLLTQRCLCRSSGEFSSRNEEGPIELKVSLEHVIADAGNIIVGLLSEPLNNSHKD